VSKKRFTCWKCGTPMKQKALYCKRCRKTRPQAVKAATATLVKAYGAQLRPVAAAKAVKPACPRCGVKSARSANCCTRCGTALSPLGAARAEKSAKAVQLQVAGSEAFWLAKAAAQNDPDAREQYRQAAREAAVRQQGADAASLMVKAAGASSVREAWLAQSDPHAREILREALYRQERRHS
jgi:hypothetical protein